MVSEDEQGAPIERNSPRFSVRAEVQFRKAGYQKASVHLIDISPTGCKMELPERAAQGETVWITLPGLNAIQARVAWVRDWMAGVEFEPPLYPSVFDLLVARLKQR